MKKPTPASRLDDELTHESTALEKLLSEHFPRREFWQGIEIEGENDPDVDHEIGWAEHGKFRLLYTRTRFDENDEAVSEEKMLLIDAPVAIREQLREYLPMFMEELSMDVDGDGNDGEDDEDLDEDSDER